MVIKNLLRKLDLTTLQLFLAVYEEGTLTRAAEREAIAVSAASKRLLELEQAVSATLFQRNARGMTLTPAGETLLHHARRVMRDIENIGIELAGHASGVRGYVRMMANLSDTHISIADIQDLAHPAPQSLEEIPDHTIIVYGETAVPEIRDINWLLEAYKKYAAPGSKGHVIRINNITGILQAVEAGIGIGVVPDYVAAQHPALERVLPDVAAPGFDVHLVYADALRQSKRVAAFRDFAVKSSKDWQY